MGHLPKSGSHAWNHPLRLASYNRVDRLAPSASSEFLTQATPPHRWGRWPPPPARTSETAGPARSGVAPRSSPRHLSLFQAPCATHGTQGSLRLPVTSPEAAGLGDIKADVFSSELWRPGVQRRDDGAFVSGGSPLPGSEMTAFGCISTRQKELGSPQDAP